MQREKYKCNLHHQPNNIIPIWWETCVTYKLSIYWSLGCFRVCHQGGGGQSATHIHVIHDDGLSYYCFKALKIGFISIQLHCINKPIVGFFVGHLTQHHLLLYILLVNPKRRSSYKLLVASYLQKLFLTTTKCLLWPNGEQPNKGKKEGILNAIVVALFDI
jgi:hypothetical protein